MEKIFENQKNILIGFLIVLLILLGLNLAIYDEFRNSFSVVGMKNPIVLIGLTSLLAFVTVATLSGYYSAKKGGHSNEHVGKGTTGGLIAFAISVISILLITLFAGPEAIMVPVVTILIVCIFAFIFLMLIMFGPPAFSGGASYDGKVSQQQNVKTDSSTEKTEDNKSSSYAWVMIPFIIVMVVIALSCASNSNSGSRSSSKQQASNNQSSSVQPAATSTTSAPTEIIISTNPNDEIDAHNDGLEYK